MAAEAVAGRRRRRRRGLEAAAAAAGLCFSMDGGRVGAAEQSQRTGCWWVERAGISGGRARAIRDVFKSETGADAGAGAGRLHAGVPA